MEAFVKAVPVRLFFISSRTCLLQHVKSARIRSSHSGVSSSAKRKLLALGKHCIETGILRSAVNECKKILEIKEFLENLLLL